MKKKVFSDRSDEHRLFISHSRKLYLPFKRYCFDDYVLITRNLSGCALRFCLFHSLTCSQCPFEY